MVDRSPSPKPDDKLPKGQGANSSKQQKDFTRSSYKSAESKGEDTSKGDNEVISRGRSRSVRGDFSRLLASTQPQESTGTTLGDKNKVPTSETMQEGSRSYEEQHTINREDQGKLVDDITTRKEALRDSGTPDEERYAWARLLYEGSLDGSSSGNSDVALGDKVDRSQKENEVQIEQNTISVNLDNSSENMQMTHLKTINERRQTPFFSEREGGNEVSLDDRMSQVTLGGNSELILRIDEPQVKREVVQLFREYVNTKNKYVEQQDMLQRYSNIERALRTKFDEDIINVVNLWAGNKMEERNKEELVRREKFDKDFEEKFGERAKEAIAQDGKKIITDQYRPILAMYKSQKMDVKEVIEAVRTSYDDYVKSSLGNMEERGRIIRNEEDDRRKKYEVETNGYNEEQRHNAYQQVMSFRLAKMDQARREQFDKLKEEMESSIGAMGQRIEEIEREYNTKYRKLNIE